MFVVELAQRCFKANNITNISVARLSSEEFTSAFVDKVEFRRLTQSGIDMKTFDLQVSVAIWSTIAGIGQG